jgi:hypothetical protein
LTPDTLVLSIRTLYPSRPSGILLDVAACDPVVEKYGDEIARVLQSGQFSGEGAEALPLVGSP